MSQQDVMRSAGCSDVTAGRMCSGSDRKLRDDDVAATPAGENRLLLTHTVRSLQSRLNHAALQQTEHLLPSMPFSCFNHPSMRFLLVIQFSDGGMEPLPAVTG